jgi:hypothetical protein
LQYCRPVQLQRLDQFGSVISAIFAVLTFLTGIGFLVWCGRILRTTLGRVRPGPRVPSSVHRLLAAQQVAAEDSAYEPWHVTQPLISDIYVEQQAESIDPEQGLNGPTVFGVHDMIRRFPDAIVIGGPGTGKSTLAKHLVRESAHFWLAARRFRRPTTTLCRTLTIRVPAARLGEAAGNTIAEALHSYFTADGEKIPDGIFCRRAVRGVDWLIVIDGTDEVLSPAVRTRLLTLIRNELNAPNRVLRLIVTSRAPLEATLSGATELRLRIFDDERLHQFATRWFGSRRTIEPEADARRYLARVSVGPLAGLVRIPLMAAMAAVIHEFDRTARLPTSRTELYAQFVEVVRRSRDSSVDVPDGAAAAPWLRGELDRLLIRLACHTVERGPGGLLTAAADYCAANAPEPIRSYLAGAAGRAALRDALLATSLLATDGTTLSFIHHSIAEYLAAAQTAGDLTEQVANLADPDRRSYALFCLARAGCAAETVRGLLDQRPSDPVRAGHLLLDGTTVEAELRWRAVGEMGRLLATENEEAGEVLSILAGLAVNDPDVADRLFAWAESPGTRPWARVLIADKAADFDPGRGLQLLITLAADRGPLLTHPCRLWAARRLVSRGHRLGAYVLRGIDAWREPVAPPAGATRTVGIAAVTNAGGALVTVAYRQIAMDARQTLAVRAESALELNDDDPAVLDVLRSTCRDRSAPGDLRRRAAEFMCRRPGTVGTATIEDILRDPSVPEDTRAVAVQVLSTRTDKNIGVILRAALRDRLISDDAKRAILDQTQWRGNLGLSLEVALDRSADPRLRTEAARFLSTRGVGGVPMRVLCIDRSAPAEARSFAITSLATSARPEDLARLRQVATDRQEDNRLRFNAASILQDRGDPTGIAVLHELAEIKHADPWLAGLVRRALNIPLWRPATTRRPVERTLIVRLPQTPPEAAQERLVLLEPLPSDPAQLRRIVRKRTADVKSRTMAARRLLRRGDRDTFDWLTDLAWSSGGGRWLQELLITELLRRGDLDAVERCRALVGDPAVAGKLRERVAAHLIDQGEPDDLSHVRYLVVEQHTDARLREILVERLLSRLEADDVEVLLELARSPFDSALTKHVVEQLLAYGRHHCVRQLWPSLWDNRAQQTVRLTLGETLAYAGTRADLDELGRLVANAATPAYLRLRVAEILNRRGEPLGREVLRILVCDNSIDLTFRSAALARITVIREVADIRAIRHAAQDSRACAQFRGSALRALAVVGPSEFPVIREIGTDTANPLPLRQQAGTTLAELGDDAGLQILDQLRPSRFALLRTARSLNLR